MKQLSSFFLLLTSLILGLTSCSDDDKNNGENPIQRLEATTEIDLSRYNNLRCIVNSVEYDFVIEGKKVTATPEDGGKIAYTWPYDPEMIGGSSGVSMYLSRMDLSWSQKIDQSTFEKMMAFDALAASKGGNLPSVITALDLGHNYSLIRFTTKNMPENAIVTVKYKNVDLYIIPNKTEEGVYQCIHPLALRAIVSVVVDGKEYYTTTLYDAVIGRGRAILRDYNNLYTFELEYNAEAATDEEKLIINNGKIVEWVNQHFED